MRWALNDLAGPPSAGGITKGQGAVGLVRGIRSDLAFVVGFLVTFTQIKSDKKI